MTTYKNLSEARSEIANRGHEPSFGCAHGRVLPKAVTIEPGIFSLEAYAAFVQTIGNREPNEKDLPPPISLPAGTVYCLRTSDNNPYDCACRVAGDLKQKEGMLEGKCKEGFLVQLNGGHVINR